MALIIVIMYAALGLNGFLTFIFGILTLIIIQAIIVARYMANEYKRVQEREITEDFDEHEKFNPMDE